MTDDNTTTTNFEGLFLNEAVSADIIKSNYTLILQVKSRGKSGDFVVSSGTYKERNDGLFIMKVVFPDGAPETPQRDLAKHLAAVLQNPACPMALYNAIADELTELSNCLDYNSPEMIEKSLLAYAASDGKKRRAK